MPLLSVKELLQDPTLGLELMAGASGLDERVSVRWAHISEIPDPTPWLEGGEILLTTGLGVGESADLQRQLVARLAAKGCAAIGFGIGIWSDAVPEVMLREADAQRLPLFAVPYEVPFIAVTRRVAHHVFEEHYSTMRGAIELHRGILGTVLAGRGIAGVLDALARHMPDFDATVFDYHGATLGTRSAANGPLLAPDVLWEAITPQWRQAPRFTTSLQGVAVHAASIRVQEEMEAVLAVAASRELLDHEVLLLEQGLTGVSLELARGLSLRESHRERVDDLLRDIADGTVQIAELEQRLSRLGVEPSDVTVVSVHRPADRSLRTLTAVVEDVVQAAGLPALVGRLRDGVHLVVGGRADDAVTAITAEVAARGWTSVSIGVSRTKPTAHELPTALREARQALKTAIEASTGYDVTVRAIGELGVAGLVAGLDHSHDVDPFVQQVLGPILQPDSQEQMPLLDTLRTYVAHGCRPGPAAAELCIHRHTLGYRLERIQKLTGRDLKNGDDLLELSLAVHLWLKRQPPAGADT